jgi:hypothetical protein
LDLLNDDIAYCVFDTDMNPNKNKIIQDAIKLAQKNHIRVITSTPSIELWFFLHYDYTTAYMNNAEVIKRLKKFYPNYEKNINIYPDIESNIDTAIERAKKLEKHQIDDGRKIGYVEANPNTEMYKIVEELRKK